MNNEDVAVFAVGYFLKTYPELLKQRFKLDELPETEVEFLDIVGKQRGCLGGGGHVFHKIANCCKNLEISSLAESAWKHPKI